MYNNFNSLGLSEPRQEQLKRIRCCFECESSTDEDTGEQVVYTGIPTTLEGFLDSIRATEDEKQKIYGKIYCESCELPLDAETKIIIESDN